MIVIAGAHPLVHLNAALNTVATLLLVAAWWQIRRGKESAHGKTMMAALGVSAAFLVSYLTYHAIAGSVKFTHPGAIRYVYYAILLSHVVLAAAVPFLAVWATWLGVQAIGWRGPAASSEPDQLGEATAELRARHRRIVRWAFPIWMYVSVTGVLVYVMLYHLWPSEAHAS